MSVDVKWVSVTGFDIIGPGSHFGDGEPEVSEGMTAAVIGEDYLVVIEERRERLIEIFEDALRQLGKPPRGSATIL